jgi:c-di-GMP-binding flagellar brake protein YcgR
MAPMQAPIEFGLENWHDYEVNSRREIIALLRAISEKKHAIRMGAPGAADTCVTSILEVDMDSNIVYLDRPIKQELDRRLLASASVAFETTLDKIRILFSTDRLAECTHAGLPALRIALPPTVIRLQRREYYRMSTPVSNPVMVGVALPAELGGGNASFPLADISCGGIAIFDNKLVLGDAVGRVYVGCRIDLPEIGMVTSSLQIRNSQDLTLLNNKSNRRLGCQFIDLPRGMLAQVQRYIAKLERERNGRATA